MSFIIDAHEDLAFNYASYQRDYRRSALENRKREAGTEIVSETDDTLLGWEEYQRGQVAMIFGTLFLVPARHSQPSSHEKHVYHNAEETRAFHHQQIDYYRLLDQSNEHLFRLVLSRSDLAAVLAPWQTQPAAFPDVTHPVGILMSIEGLEGVGKISEIEAYWDLGVRAIGPVWAGGRFCGGTKEFGGFTSEGYELLKFMARFGYILDLSHMTDLSARQAMDAYEGTVIASHANARALLGADPGERHFTDEAIRSLIQRGGVMGIIPYNHFLTANWNREIDGRNISLDLVIKHIDYVCQLAGNARHVAFGTDFDGGFGLQSVPKEINTIADMRKMAPLLKSRGYSSADIELIFGKNWQRILENALPV
jgi:membrane dipeptidase